MRDGRRKGGTEERRVRKGGTVELQGGMEGGRKGKRNGGRDVEMNRGMYERMEEGREIMTEVSR